MLGWATNLLIVLASALVHWWLWKRLVRDTTRPGTRARRVGTVLTAASAALAAAPRILVPALGPDAGRWLAWPGYTWLAVLLYLALPLLVAELIRAAGWLRSRRAGRHDPGPAVPPTAAELNRRLFLSRTAGATAGVISVATTGYGLTSALGPPRVQRVPVGISRLDPRLSGLRIAVVSDLHLGTMLGRSHTERIVRHINGLEADVVAVVGDLADGLPAELGAAARPLRSLESTHGSFFVTGNHEYLYDGADAWVGELHALGVRGLRNERVEIHHNGATLDLAGVEDVTGEEYGTGPDFARTLDGRDPTRPVVLLAHQPILATQAARHGVDLQLSGHTHGGQFFPITQLSRLWEPVVSGLGKVEDTTVYVTNGAGFFGPPVRVGAPPEVTLIELRPAGPREQ
ncbi:metallophosphoesterase [Streptomyces xiamenensis]|uniref:metallophosphoesterase n=1 Tax=Streptomyces xiamenensis TaxID=408015 RepID=UPI0035E3B3A4